MLTSEYREALIISKGSGGLRDSPRRKEKRRRDARGGARKVRAAYRKIDRSRRRWRILEVPEWSSVSRRASPRKINRIEPGAKKELRGRTTTLPSLEIK